VPKLSPKEQALIDRLSVWHPNDFVAEAYILTGVQNRLLGTDNPKHGPDNCSTVAVGKISRIARQDTDPLKDQAFLLAHPQPTLWQAFLWNLLTVDSDERFSVTLKFLGRKENARMAAQFDALAVSLLVQKTNLLQVEQRARHSAKSRSSGEDWLTSAVNEAQARGSLLEILLKEVDIRTGRRYADVLPRVRDALRSLEAGHVPTRLQDFLDLLEDRQARCEQALGVKEEISANTPEDERHAVQRTIDRSEHEVCEQRKVLRELHMWMRPSGGHLSNMPHVRYLNPFCELPTKPLLSHGLGEKTRHRYFENRQLTGG
jgi:hypothetical protein